MLDCIKNYLSTESTGALMVSGEWGCGKTYHIEKIVMPALQKEGWNPVKVSLFGIESVNEIPLKLLAEYLDVADAKAENKVKLNFKKKIGNLIFKVNKQLPWLKVLSEKIDINRLITENSNFLYRFISKEKTVIFLDDIERVIDTIDVHILLGTINGLVEQRGYKVVVIANNSYMQQKGEAKMVFKEKVIEKTLVYEPDVVAIFKVLCEEYNKNDSTFTEFMTAQKAVEVIDPSYSSYKDLQVELHNIRILKFALAHFYKIYEACKVFLKDENDENDENKKLANSYLLSLWACTVGVAIEYKKDRLTYKDRLQFSQYVESPTIKWLPDFNIQEAKEMFDETGEDEVEKTQKEKKQRKHTQHRVANIFNNLVKSHDFPVIVAPQVFDFVTAGVSLDEDGLKKVWEEYKSRVQRNSKSPAYALLQKFINSPWNMSNEEIPDALEELAKFVEDGKYDDNISYINAATYLQHLSSLTSFSKEEIKSKITQGIDKIYANVSSLGVPDKMNFDILETDIPKESLWVVEYERKKMDEVTTKKLNDDIKEVCRQFIEDLPTLANRLTIQYGDTKTPDFLSYPILHHIPAKDIFEKVNKIQPKEVMALYHILNGRFLQQIADPKVYEKELQFVTILEKALRQKQSDKKVYADFLIEDQLNGVIKKIQK